MKNKDILERIVEILDKQSKTIDKLILVAEQLTTPITIYKKPNKTVIIKKKRANDRTK